MCISETKMAVLVTLLACYTLKKVRSNIKPHYWTRKGFLVTQRGKGFLAHRLESRPCVRGSVILMIGLCCCTFIRLCTVRRDGRDGHKGGAEALNQDKKEKKNNALSTQQHTLLTFQLSRHPAFLTQTDTNMLTYFIF